ncbi:MAG: hypothetical protein Tsb0020_22970 [Haliangiales bacterium]
MDASGSSDDATVDIFEKAIGMPPDERASYLDRVCRPEKRSEIEDMLRADRLKRSVPFVRSSATPIGFLPSAHSPIEAGQSVDQYIIGKKLGEGGMGIVYEARHKTLHKRAAIKILHRDLVTEPGHKKRFIDEAKAAAKIEHPGIVQVHHAGEHINGDLYIVMEYLDGETLAKRLDRLTLPEQSACSIGREIALALSAAHQHNIVHCDLKPDNLMLVADNVMLSGERIKLLDFGIAKLLQEFDGECPTGSHVMGTPPYMAPEQWRGLKEVGPRSDLYALGIILFEMLCGRRPFVCESQSEYKRAHCEQPAPRVRSLRPNVAPELDELVAQLLAKAPSERPQSAKALLTTFKRLTLQRDPGPHSRPTHEKTRCGHANVPLPSERHRGTLPLINTPNASGATIETRVLITARSDPRRAVSRSTNVDRPSAAVPESVQYHPAEDSCPTEESACSEHRQLRALPEPEHPLTPLRTGWLGFTRRTALATSSLFVIGALLIVAYPEILPSLAGAIGGVVPPPPDYEAIKRDCDEELRDVFDYRASERIEPLLTAIVTVATPEAAPLLQTALNDTAPELRRRAAHAYWQLAWPEAGEHIRSAMQEAGGRLRNDFATALLALGDRESFPAVLWSLNQSTDPRARLVAALAIAESGDARERERVTHVLARAYESNPAGSEMWATAARGQLALGDEEVRADLTRMLAGPDSAQAMTAAALLADQQDEQAIEYLRRIVADPDARGRSHAALILAQQDDEAALEFVPDGLIDTDPDMRRSAVMIAGRLADKGGAEHIRTIAALISDDPALDGARATDPDVGNAACVATLALIAAHTNEVSSDE